jgi:hypothetical protein
MEPIFIREDTIEELLISEIAQKLEPKELTKKHTAILNALEELVGRREFEAVAWETKASKRKRASQWGRQFMAKLSGQAR